VHRLNTRTKTTSNSACSHVAVVVEEVEDAAESHTFRSEAALQRTIIAVRHSMAARRDCFFCDAGSTDRKLQHAAPNVDRNAQRVRSRALDEGEETRR
jgi:hypothetical protein